jgi:hypothetical protein
MSTNDMEFRDHTTDFWKALSRRFFMVPLEILDEHFKGNA